MTDDAGMEGKIDSLIQEGKRQFLSCDYAGAIRLFCAAAGKDPLNKDALFELGKTYYVLRDFASARQFLEKAGRMQPGNAHICILLAKTYRSLGEPEKALKLLLDLKGSKGAPPEVTDELSVTYAQISGGRPAAAKTAARPADDKEFVQKIEGHNFEGNYGLTRELVPQALKDIPAGRILLRNRLLNELEIAQGKTVIESRPRRLTVTLSNKCNLSCIMCLTSRFNWEIARDRIEEIFSLFPYLEKVMWQGGEVFALDFFEEILSTGFKYPHLRHSIVTNGQLIDERTAERLVSNNVELTVSVDGVTREVYEYIRRGASFDRLLANLKLISELKKKSKSGMVMNLNVAVMKSNYGQLADFIEFGREYGFNFICLMPIHIHLKTPEDIFTNNDAQALAYITQASKRVDELAAKYGIRVENRLPRLSEECPEHEDGPGPGDDNTSKLLCHIPWQQLLVDYDGTVRPDCLCRPEKSAGNLSDGHSLDQIWNSQVMQEYRKRIVDNSYTGWCNPICSSGKICQSHLKIP